jgi:hypothetical protein
VRVRIIDSFAEAGATAVQRGCVMEVPELVGRLWIRIKRAVAAPLPQVDEQPSSRPATLEMPTSRKKVRR